MREIKLAPLRSTFAQEKRVFFSVFISCMIFFTAPSFAQPDSAALRDSIKKAEYQERVRQKIAELQRRKDSINALQQAAKNVKNHEGKNIDEFVQRNDSLMKKLCVNDEANKCNDRCLDVLFTLAELHYEKSRDAYIREREKYATAMETSKSDSSSHEKPPVNPTPDYSKAIRIYKEFLACASKGAGIGMHQYGFEVYYRLYQIYTVRGCDSLAAFYKELLIEKFPGRAQKFGLKEYTPHERAMDLEKLKESDYSLKDWGNILYRKAELYLRSGDRENARKGFGKYVDRCKKGVYSHLCKEAEEYLKLIEKK